MSNLFYWKNDGCFYFSERISNISKSKYKYKELLMILSKMDCQCDACGKNFTWPSFNLADSARKNLINVKGFLKFYRLISPCFSFNKNLQKKKKSWPLAIILYDCPNSFSFSFRIFLRKILRWIYAGRISLNLRFFLLHFKGNKPLPEYMTYCN